MKVFSVFNKLLYVPILIVIMFIYLLIKLFQTYQHFSSTKNLFDDYSFFIGLERNFSSKELKIYLILKAKIISESLIKKSLNFLSINFEPESNEYWNSLNKLIIKFFIVSIFPLCKRYLR